MTPRLDEPGIPTWIGINEFQRVVAELHHRGWAQADIDWAENCRAPADEEAFAREAIFVICNSGMRFTVAQGIFQRVMPALLAGQSARTGFGHPGKAAAIDDIWARRSELLEAYTDAPDKVEFCASLPWIGNITKFHLAKNFGVQVSKPDVHLQRLSRIEGVSAQELCERLSKQSGYTVNTVDTLLWRACAVGILDPHTQSLVTTFGSRAWPADWYVPALREAA